MAVATQTSMLFIRWIECDEGEILTAACRIACGSHASAKLTCWPIMIQHLLIAAGLVAVTVAVHAAGFGLALGTVVRRHVVPPSGAWAITWLLVRLAWLLILIHIIEISLWALFYLW